MTKVLLLKLYPTHELPTLSFDAHFSPCEKSQKRNLKARHKTKNKDIGAKCEFQNERLGLQIYLLEKLEFAANYTLIRNSVSLWNKSVCLGNCTGCRCSDCSYNNKSILNYHLYLQLPIHRCSESCPAWCWWPYVRGWSNS